MLIANQMLIAKIFITNQADGIKNDDKLIEKSIRSKIEKSKSLKLSKLDKSKKKKLAKFKKPPKSGNSSNFEIKKA